MSGIEIGAGALGTLLLGVVAYFLKTRDARLSGVEKQAEDTSKDVAVITGHLDTISKRLSAGAESFKEITQTQKQLQQTQTDIILNFVKIRDFEKEKDKTEARFVRVDKSIDGIKDVVNEVKLSVQGIEKTMNGGLDTMKDLLAKVVRIPTDPKDRNNG